MTTVAAYSPQDSSPPPAVPARLPIITGRILSDLGLLRRPSPVSVVIAAQAGSVSSPPPPGLHSAMPPLSVRPAVRSAFVPFERNN